MEEVQTLDVSDPIIIAPPEEVVVKTPEELEAERLAEEARLNKRKNNPDANPTPPAPTPEPTEPVVTDNDITSIRTATPEDPTGSEEIIIDNNDVEAPESPVDETELNGGESVNNNA